MGRQTLLNKELQESICKDIAEGAYLKDAVAINGITRQTFLNWLKRGRNGEDVFTDFFDAVKKAEAEHKKATRIEMRVLATESKRWEQSAWQLERRYPEDYGRHEVIHHVDEEAARMTLEELKEALNKPEIPQYVEGEAELLPQDVGE